MSRVDEALGRTASQLSSSSADRSQELFRPAWPAVANTVTRRRTAPSEISFASAWSHRLANSRDGHPGMVEQFRRLASTLHKTQRATGLKSVMVTSASTGDGKTLTAINLALVLAESFHGEVLLIDADLRRPSIPNVLDIDNSSGLSEVLTSPGPQKLALSSVCPGLTVLPAGRPIANSIEALTSPRMQQILDEASHRYAWVIVDAPPVGLTTDSRLLTELVGGSLFVVRVGHSQHPDVQRAITAIGREHLLGIVLNGVPEQRTESYYGTYAPPVRPA